MNLLLARAVTSKAAWAPLAGFALTVLMILYGESILPRSDSGGDNFTDRFGELAMAAVWAIGSLYVLQAYFPSKDSADSRQEADDTEPVKAADPAKEAR